MRTPSSRSAGGYAANVEAVHVAPPEPLPYDDAPAAHVHDTPDTPTIQTLVDHANSHVARADRPWTAADTLKNVLVMVRKVDGSREPLAIAVPGDREVDLKRLAAQLEPDEAEPFVEEDFADHPTLAKGYIGPGVLGTDNPSGIRYLADPRVVTGTRWVTGADTPGRHVFDLVCGRDFTPDGVLDVAEIKEGDPAPDGSGPLRLARGIEMGHIFQLGRKYAEALGCKVLDSNGKLVTVTMGSYGVGVSRAVAAVAEGTSDEKGLCWPRELAPFDVQILATGKGEAVLAAATDLARELDDAGVGVLLDDRKASPGVKFADSEILGMPTSVVVGRGLADGVVELRDRASGGSENIAYDEAVSRIVAVVHGRPDARRRLVDPLEISTARRSSCLVLVAFVAGWVDAVVGGGGLIQLPALLIALPADTPPASILGTNKVSSVWGTADQLARCTRSRSDPTGAASSRW